MTRKISISLPDDVAEQLDNMSNVSAFITDAVRQKLRAKRTHDALRDAGFVITEEGKERMRQRLRALKPITPEMVAAQEAFLERIKRGEA
jgi:metal-responsive CopG/Arc/MetJ family transcriptional regulator